MIDAMAKAPPLRLIYVARTVGDGVYVGEWRVRVLCLFHQQSGNRDAEVFHFRGLEARENHEQEGTGIKPP